MLYYLIDSPLESAGGAKSERAKHMKTGGKKNACVLSRENLYLR